MFIFTIIASWFISKTKSYSDDSPFYRFLFYACIKITLFFGRIHVKAENMNLLPEDGRFLLVGNHRSNFDPILCYHLMEDKDLIFISKPENFKFPCFGRIMHRIGCLAIDRENPRNAMKTLMKAADEIKKDKFSVGIYPEGTRNKTDKPLLDFHNGLFKIAQMAKVPIVVVATNNTEKIFKNFPWKHTDVSLKIVEVIPAEKVLESKTSELGDYIKNLILDNLK